MSTPELRERLLFESQNIRDAIADSDKTFEEVESEIGLQPGQLERRLRGRDRGRTAWLTVDDVARLAFALDAYNVDGEKSFTRWFREPEAVQA